MKKLLLDLWNLVYYAWNTIDKLTWLFFDSFNKLFYAPPSVIGVEESIRYIVSNRCSVARFGDGLYKLLCVNIPILF